MVTRRSLFSGMGAAFASAAVGKAALGGTAGDRLHGPPGHAAAAAPPNGRPYLPVATLNGWTLPWRMRDGVKEFHLVAEPVMREIAPGMRAHLWGYNGQSPGPTIEVVEGDRVRMFVTNRLPEATSIHWHGQRLPNGMDGVSGLNQPSIKPGQTFVYEFRAQRAGTFMYHPHADETTQMAMGMMGFWVTHPPTRMPCRRPGLRVSAERLRHRSGKLHAQGEHHAGFQSLDLQQPRLSRHRSDGRAARRARAHPRRQSHHDQPSDPSAWARVRGRGHRRRLDSAERPLARSHRRTSPSARCAPSNSRRRRPATGRFIATRAITP